MRQWKKSTYNREDFSEEVTWNERFKNENSSPGKNCGQNILDHINGMCKGPAEEKDLKYFKNLNEATVAGT